MAIEANRSWRRNSQRASIAGAMSVKVSEKIIKLKGWEILVYSRERSALCQYKVNMSKNGSQERPGYFSGHSISFRAH